jgi:hypothetical protein
MKTFLSAALIACFSLAATQQTAQKKASSKASVKKAVAPAKKPIAKKRTPPKPVATWRNRQSVPSADRYREIQTALASRGYLRSEDATGTWNQASIDALKKFQTEQNLDSSGKINSLSLIALGLGPKRDGSTTPPKVPFE